MILLIDNYDSFVYNLGRYVGQLGHHYVVYRNDKISIATIEAMKPSHIIISPGPCRPNEAGISLEVIQHFSHNNVPILGVCLGHQAIGQAFGGQVVKAKRPMHGMESSILHSGKGVLQGLANPLKVARYHSLIVSSEKLPDCLEVTSFSDDGEIMALQHKQLPVHGVQFHPESVLTQQGYQLLDNFLKMSHSDFVTRSLI